MLAPPQACGSAWVPCSFRFAAARDAQGGVRADCAGRRGCTARVGPPARAQAITPAQCEDVCSAWVACLQRARGGRGRSRGGRRGAMRSRGRYNEYDDDSEVSQACAHQHAHGPGARRGSCVPVCLCSCVRFFVRAPTQPCESDAQLHLWLHPCQAGMCSPVRAQTPAPPQEHCNWRMHTYTHTHSCACAHHHLKSLSSGRP